jgi:plasmid stability protein
MKPVSFNLPEDLSRQLRLAAASREISRSRLVTAILTQWLANPATEHLARATLDQMEARTDAP